MSRDNHMLWSAYRIIHVLCIHVENPIYKTFNDMLTAFAFEAVILHTIHRLFMPVSQNTGTKEEIEELYDSSCSGRHIR